MLSKPVLNCILHNDALTRGLTDPEARILVEWLVERAELLAQSVSATTLGMEVQQMCTRARALARFVVLWCHEADRGAALQLAGASRFHCPLPTSPDIDPCELMCEILAAEAKAAD